MPNLAENLVMDIYKQLENDFDLTDKDDCVKMLQSINQRRDLPVELHVNSAYIRCLINEVQSNVFTDDNGNVNVFRILNLLTKQK